MTPGPLPVLCSGHAGVRTVHAGGVQVGVRLVATGVIHVHVCVGTSLWRGPPLRLGRRERKSSTCFCCCFEPLASVVFTFTWVVRREALIGGC